MKRIIIALALLVSLTGPAAASTTEIYLGLNDETSKFLGVCVVLGVGLYCENPHLNTGELADGFRAFVRQAVVLEPGFLDDNLSFMAHGYLTVGLGLECQAPDTSLW